MTPAEKSREALRRYRESVDLEDAFSEDEITQNIHVHLPAPPNLPSLVQAQALERAPSTPDEDPGFSKLKALITTGAMALGTGIVVALLQHCG